MRTLYFVLLILLALVSCRTTQVENKPFIWTSPDSLVIDPTLLTHVNGWEPFLVNSKTVAWFPTPVNSQKIKVKNSGNTDNSQKKSNNTETKQKDVGNSKAKGEAIIGDDNAPVEAGKHAIIGDGNTVKEESISWWWLLLPAAILGVVLWWYRKFRE